MEKIKNNILDFLDIEEREQFLNELLVAIEDFKKTNNFSLIEECIENWEDVAELNSIPNFKKHVWERYNKLRDAGKIN